MVSVAKQMFPAFASFGRLKTWVNRRSRLSLWFNKCRKALMICRYSGKVSGRGSTIAFYRRLVEEGCEDDLRMTLGLRYIQLESLFLRTFGLKTMDNFQNSLTWQCYRGALPVQDKLARHGQCHTQTSPRCGLDRETIQHAIVVFKSVGHVGLYRTPDISAGKSTAVD